MPPCASACHVPDARSWRSEIPRAPEPPPKLPPTTLRESASDRDVTSASARSVGRSSPCRPAPQAASSSSSSVLHPLQGAGSTLPTTARLRHAALPKGHDETPFQQPILHQFRDALTVLAIGLAARQCMHMLWVDQDRKSV